MGLQLRFDEWRLGVFTALDGLSGIGRSSGTYKSIDENRFGCEARLTSVGEKSGDVGLEGPLAKGFDMRRLSSIDNDAGRSCLISGAMTE
jgi:hypothetical protein